jgi:ABC-2 type transport system permease protein
MSAAGLVAAERIKLGSVRSPWWCAGLAVASVVGLTVLTVLIEPGSAGGGPEGGGSNPFLLLGLMLVLVLAAVAVTTEYRYSTVRLTFEAVPNRTAAMLAKAVVVAAVGGAIGLLASFGTWAAVWLLDPLSDVGLRGYDDWWVLLSPGPVFAVCAVLALAVGILVRHTAAAVSIALVWPLMGEQLIGVVPGFGPAVQPWLPFVNAGNAMSTGGDGLPFGPVGSLVYVAGIAAAALAVALVVVNRRDA